MARNPALAIVRVAVAAMLVIHGVARVWSGGVAPFGEFLSQNHVPFGSALAWAITVVEIAGGLTLAAGRFVRPLCAWFVLVLLAGIALVHGREGWFVVGLGRNGVEYSVLLIACLLAVAYGTPGRDLAETPGDAPLRLPEGPPAAGRRRA